MQWYYTHAANYIDYWTNLGWKQIKTLENIPGLDKTY